MPTHSTPALAHDEHEGKSWSHFVFLDRHLLQADIDLDIWPPAEPRRRGEEGAVNVGLWVVGEGMPEAGDCRFFGDGAPGTAFETAVWGGFGFMTDTLSVSGWVSGWVSVCGGGTVGKRIRRTWEQAGGREVLFLGLGWTGTACTLLFFRDMLSNSRSGAGAYQSPWSHTDWTAACGG